MRRIHHLSLIGRALPGIAAVCITIGWVPFAWAADGRIEINQSCATVTGCHPNDTPGFPVHMNSQNAASSFVLTSDLVVPDANTTGIFLPNGGTLDLNGFQIQGPTACTGKPAVCSGGGNGIGVFAGIGNTIKNGTIRGMGLSGIQMGGGRVENMLIQSNGGRGITAGGAEGLHVSKCRILQNGSDGIYTASGSPRGSLIVDNAIFANTAEGIEGTGITVRGNMIDSNGSYGLKANVGSQQAAYGQNGFYDNNGAGTNAQVIGGQSLGGNWCGDAAC